jgi:hypothetical protein
MAIKTSITGRREKGRGWLMGDLSEWPLLDTLHWVNQTGHTAMIRVGAGLNAGVLFVKNGQLFRVEWGSLKGEQALASLLTLRAGRFIVIHRDVPDAMPNMRTATQELLLRHTQSQDEHKRNVA